MVSEIKGVGGTGHIVSPISAGKVSEKKIEGNPLNDTVVFSDILQEVNRAQEEGAVAADSGRTAKVAALKAQVANGSYKPDLQKVANSLVQFLKER